MENYTVQKKDTIFSIARKFGIPAFEIIRANNLQTPYNIIEGQILSIPAVNYNIYDYYTVEKGDTLYKIANNIGITSEMLSQINGLENEEFIYIGQTLFIPKKDIKLYITKEGETLEDVSEYFKAEPLDILYSNNNIFLLPEQLIIYRKT